MKMNVRTDFCLVMLVLLSACCKEEDYAICEETGIVIHEEDLEIFTSDEVDRVAYYDSGCTQCELEERLNCAEDAYAVAVGSLVLYPAAARENNIQGRVIIGFVVEKDGSVSNFEVVEGIGFGREEEVIKIIQTIVPWIPAVRDGVYVRSYRESPMTFKLG